MKMTEHKRFRIFTFMIEVELRDDVPEGAPEYADGGVCDDPYLSSGFMTFKIWFSFIRRIPTMSMIAHECWHLYMTILDHVDIHSHTFSELNHEIYAYFFQDIFNNVMNTVVSSKLCKKKIDEENNRK